jgi:hypothetical protein
MVTVSEDRDQEDSAEINRYMVFGAYGKLMLDFQALELTLWQFLMQRIKPRTTADQRFHKIEGWYSTTLGRLYESVKAQGHLPQVSQMNSMVLSKPGITSRTTFSLNGLSSYPVQRCATLHLKNWRGSLTGLLLLRRH